MFSLKGSLTLPMDNQSPLRVEGEVEVFKCNQEVELPGTEDLPIFKRRDLKRTEDSPIFPSQTKTGEHSPIFP